MVSVSTPLWVLKLDIASVTVVGEINSTEHAMLLPYVNAGLAAMLLNAVLPSVMLLGPGHDVDMKNVVCAWATTAVKPVFTVAASDTNNRYMLGPDDVYDVSVGVPDRDANSVAAVDDPSKMYK